MSEAKPPASGPVSSSPTAPAPQRKKKRWWLRILIAIPVLLILLLALAPTLVSTSPVRGIIVSKVNDLLNGKVQMDDLSVGWTSGVSVKGVKLFDDHNAQILELKSLEAPVSLIDAARGTIDLKTVTVDGLNGVLRIDKNGRMNFANLLKQAKTEVEAAKEKTEIKTEPGKLPDVTGNVVVKNSRFTIEQEGRPPIFIDQLDSNIKIANINQPIENDVAITVRVGDGKPGTIKLAGKAGVIKNNTVDPTMAGANVDEKLDIANIDLASATPFLPKALIESLKGMTSGQFTINVTDGKSASVQGGMKIDELALSGPLLKNGKPYSAKSIELTIPKTVVAMPDGPEKWQAFKDIENAVTISIRPPTGEPATISVTGTAASTSLDNATTRQTLEIKNLDLGQFAGFIDPKLIDTLQGVTGGAITLNVDKGKQATVEGSINVAGVEASGPALKGDRFVSKQILVTIPKTNVALPDGLAKWQSSRTTLGTEAAPLVAQIDQAQGQLFKATVFADVATQAILDVLDDKKPGIEGKVKIIADGNVGQLFQSLPMLLHVAKGVSVEKGQLNSAINIVLTTEEARLNTTANISGVSGTNEGKTIALQPIDFSAGVTSLGGIDNIARLRDLKLGLQSAFASADFSGRTLADLKGTAQAQLEAMQKEMSQIIDFGNLKLAGALNIDIKSAGDLTQPGGTSDATLDATLSNLKVEGLSGKQPVVLTRVQTLASVHAIRGGDKDFISQIQNIKVTTQAGESTAPILDLVAGGDVDLRDGKFSATFDLSKLAIDLPRVERVFGAMVPALTEQNIKFPNGAIGITAKGTYADNQAVISSAKIAARSLNITKAGAKLLNNYNLDIQTAAKASLGDAKTVKVLQLSVLDSTGLLVAKMTGEELSVNIAADKTISGKGGLQFGSDLVEVSKILKALSATPDAPAAKSGDVRSGKLAGQVQLATVANNALGITSQININNLVVTTPTGVTEPQEMLIKAEATASGDFKTITAPSVTVTSKLVNVAITDVQAELGAKVVFDLLKKANVKVDVPDVPGLYALANAFVPPAPVTPAVTTAKPQAAGASDAKPAEAPLPPMQLTGGKIHIDAVVTHASPLTLNLSNCAIDGLAFKRGAVSYAFQPINLKVVASVANEGDKITRLNVSSLTGNLGIAQLAMPTPIVINDPLGTPTAQGAIKLDGKVEDATKVLEALQGKNAGELFPYQGAYALAQTLGTEGKKITLNGTAQVSKFVVLNAKDKKPAFTEDLIDVKNNLSVEMASKSASINSLTMNMTGSKAVGLNVKGGISDWERARNFSGVQADVTYDLAKIWTIIKPMLTPEQQEKYADVQIGGQFTKTFLVSGSYPANVPMQQAIQKLVSSGSVAVGTYEHNGLSVQTLEVPITLRDGILSTIYADKPAGANRAAPAIANGGQLDLSEISVDLRSDPPRVSIPDNKQILTGATINPVFAKTWLAKIINNPLFAGAQQATGVIDLKVIHCDRLPAGLLIQQKTKANDGSAELAFSMNNLHIGMEGLSALKSVFHQDSFEAKIQDGRVSIANGITKQNILFESNEFKLGFNGNVDLGDLKFMPMNVDLPAKWIVKRFKNDPNLIKWIPDQISVVMKGSVMKPDLAADAVIQKLITEALPKAAIGGLLGDNKDKKKNQDNGNTQQKPDDPLGDLLKQLGKDKDKKKKKK